MAVRSACARARATRGSSGRGARGARGGIRSRLGRRAGPAQGTRAPRLARASGALDLCPDWDHALDQASTDRRGRSEEHTSELQSQSNLVCRLLLEKKKNKPMHVSPIQTTSESHAIAT